MSPFDDVIMNWFASFSFYIIQTNNSWDTAISKFDLDNSKVNVMCEVKGRDNIIHLVSNWSIYFPIHVNHANHSWDMGNSVWPWQNTSEILKKKTPKIKLPI